MTDYIKEVDILDDSKDNFLTYTEEVLTDRAIPSAEDGLLSAQRKILWTMEDYLKMNNKSKTKKCQAIVGSTLSTAYMHGDASCYGVLTKMSQEYLMRYPLIIGQGSLGTQEANDMVASARYTEAKPSKFADLMMENFKKNAVPLKETYNGEFMEPVILPGLFPNALCNGRQAIGISMAHNSAPHNLSEVCDAIIAYIRNNNLTIDELLEIMPGPDFPLKNIIINKNDVKEAFKTGKSKVSLKIRGIYEINKDEVIFTTIPYRTYRNKIKEQIEKNIDELEKVIDDFNDESNLGNNRLVFKIKKGVNPEAAVAKLFALTDLQTTLSYNMNYIVDGTPKLCSMLDLIKAYVIHQNNVLINVSNFDLEKAKARKHILEGLILIINSIDKAIELIRESLDKDEAIKNLLDNFNLDKTQAKAILEMKLVRLTKLDKNDLIKELEEKKKVIAELEKIINDKVYRNETLIEKILDMKKKFGDTRRTELVQLDITPSEKEIETVIPEDCVVIVSQSGLIKRIPKNSFKVQKRNGVGIKSKDGAILTTISTNTIDNLMVFTNKGKMYKLLVDNVPSGTNASKGTSISQLIEMENGEEVAAVTSLHRKTDAEYVVFITKNGLIKKTSLEEYTSVKRSTGIIAIKLKEEDQIANVTFLKDEDLILITKKGMAIRFKTTVVKPTGRVTMGVKGINLKDEDSVLVGIPVHKETDYLSIFTVDGHGKKMELNELSIQAKGGKGLKISKDAEVAAAALISDEDNLLIIGEPNTICISAIDVPKFGRTSLGNLMIKNSRIKNIVKI